MAVRGGDACGKEQGGRGYGKPAAIPSQQLAHLGSGHGGAVQQRGWVLGVVGGRGDESCMAQQAGGSGRLSAG